MANTPPKSETAFRTIGEVSDELGVQRHILRFWETRFPQLRPLQRAGNRRYYRPQDIALVRQIDRLINREGYTIKGAQAVLTGGTPPAAAPTPADAQPTTVATDGDTVMTALPATATATAPALADATSLIAALLAIRTRLTNAIDQDDIAARLAR